MRAARGLRALLAGGLCALALAGCEPIYEQARPGQLQGQLVVLWVGEGGDAVGDGRFVLVSASTKDPLRFTRPDGTVLRPGMIYTDGGSIPRGVQPLRGFSPWGYAPAYMIHDWLFVARKCLTDGQATEAEKAAVADMAFRESAVILAEVIRTLVAERRVQPDDVAPAAISAAVASPVSRALWRAEGACAAARLTPEHMAQVEAALPGATGDKQALRARSTVPPARVVARIGF